MSDTKTTVSVVLSARDLDILSNLQDMIGDSTFSKPDRSEAIRYAIEYCYYSRKRLHKG